MNFALTHGINVYNHMGITNPIDPKARRLFEKMLNRGSGIVGGFLNRFRSSDKCLKTLAENSDRIGSRHYVGRVVVNVEDIHGTLDRYHDFDHEFRPLNESDEDRWARVATAMMHGVELPPLELIQVGDEFYVKDGHHRISVSRALGFSFLDAIVERWEIA